MAPDRSCSHTYEDGRPCDAPSNFVDPETGYCPAHGPNASERMAEQGRKGAETTAKKLRGEGLDPDDLPPLDSPQAAERWLEAVGRAVATGELSHNAGKAVARLVREFLRAREAGTVAEEIEELRDKVAALRRGELEVLE